MKIQESAENYLETILMLKEEKGAVRSIDIARKMDFSKPSISRAMSLLRENGYITMDKEGLIDLTDAGMEIASRIYERRQGTCALNFARGKIQPVPRAVESGEGEGFVPLYELLFAVAVRLYVVRVFLRKRPLQSGILFAHFCVGAQVVA